MASIGNQIGQRDHATVLHACKTVDNLTETDKQFRKYVDDLTKEVNILKTSGFKNHDFFNFILIKKTLMVCLGNVCHSLLAESILKSKVNTVKVFVYFVGTVVYRVGDFLEERSVAVAKKYEIDIENQTARKFKVKYFEDFDFIYAMDDSNYQSIFLLSRGKEDTRKVK